MFAYSSGFDKLLILIGTIASIAIGGGLPALIIFMGELTDTFVIYEMYNGMSKLSAVITENYYDTHLYPFIHLNDSQTYLDNLNRDFPQFSLNIIQLRLKLDNKSFVDKFDKTAFRSDKQFEKDFISDAYTDSCFMLVVAGAFLVAGYIMVATFSAAANNQTHRIRILFFKAILKQDITWYDTKTSGDFATKVTADLDKIQEGIGDKVALCIFSFSTVLCSLGTAFYYGWELTLVILSVTPVLVVSFSIIGKIQARYSTTEADSYGKAGAVAEEVLGAVRTVYAFGGQEKEIERYDRNLEPAKKSGIRRQLFTALGMGTMWLCMYCSYGLAFWYGVRLIIRSIDNHNSQYEPSTMLIVFFMVLMGTFSIGQTAPYFEAFAQARGAAALIFEVMNRVPEIDSSSRNGETFYDFKGRVELRNAHFNYPARSDVQVLRGLSLVAEPGETVALVGPSGCGKSTVIQLIQRFYDVSDGEVLIDNKNIKDLNVGWLRDQIGVVGQEPVLFGCSIAENIKLGYSSANNNDIESAAKDANALDFIMQLPKQFDTLVGERGSQLSGGQKQRIAIARALVRKPKILLLDESTSALDNQSESIVQAALDRASIGRTTFIVAHRLSTVINADKIIAINNGIVEEVGTHEELMQKEGLYYNLVKSQQRVSEENDDLDNETEVLDTNLGEKQLLLREFSIDSEKNNNDLDFRRKSSVIRLLKPDTESPSLIRLSQLLKPDKYIVIIGAFMAFIMGLIIPAFAIIFGEILGTLSKSSIEEIQEDVLLYSLLFVAMGIASGIASFLQLYLFGVSGERLTMRLRKTVLTAMLKQEIGWYDMQENSTGALCSRLSADASSVQGAAGSRLSTLCQAVSTLTAGSFISFYYSWKLGIVISFFIPLVIISTYFQMKIISGQATDDKKTQEEATRIAVEAIGSVRTVASLHQESTFTTNYSNSLQKQFIKSKIRAHLRGITFGLAQGMGNFAYGIGLLYGSKLIVDKELTYGNLFKAVEAIIFGTAMVGHSVAFAPDYLKGKIAAVYIFKLLDRIPKIIVNSLAGDKPDKYEGNVNFQELEFKYPSRPDQKILRGLSFDVSKGQTVALVGSSGCGKSTIIQLIQRFYDCDTGNVILDNKTIFSLNIPWLRSKLGIVSQEPVLFAYSIAENIAYGDNSRVVPMDEIVRAAEKANIHNFIKSLPMGYETPVGDKGTQLSGGQKQRIAIARALIRDPQILLLDEATSALDSESEKVVQQALDEAREGRTCIVIAHRLSTIQNADKIVVINKGKVVEEGTHQQLLAKRGAYYKLYSLQSASN
ncbi:ATP-dependent translocase ABCB1-like [Oppia nitens]|uniref:ATP-dependent translocase ABCB1-like n=1 Tax=Oppia nitens TaxID=1686743 RepID=UPI0023DB31F2|nr:ATP-dependent translocase ABCB1-like [Oppia nitens]